MITNPQVGMQVKYGCFVCTDNQCNYSYRGTIISIVGDIISVRRDNGFIETQYLCDLVSIVLTPEEQDQQQRRAHADKYL